MCQIKVKPALTGDLDVVWPSASMPSWSLPLSALRGPRFRFRGADLTVQSQSLRVDNSMAMSQTVDARKKFARSIVGDYWQDIYIDYRLCYMSNDGCNSGCSHDQAG